MAATKNGVADGVFARKQRKVSAQPRRRLDSHVVEVGRKPRAASGEVKNVSAGNKLRKAVRCLSEDKALFVALVRTMVTTATRYHCRGSLVNN